MTDKSKEEPYSVKLGHDAKDPTFPGKNGGWVFGIKGIGNALQVFPDGSILVYGVVPATDWQVVDMLRTVVREYDKNYKYYRSLAKSAKNVEKDEFTQTLLKGIPDLEK